MIYVLYFSPNGTTLRTMKNIIEGMDAAPIYVDLAVPENRRKDYQFSPDDLVLYGTITAGMLFACNKEIFRYIHGNGAAFAGIAMYGNGYYGVTLKQLNDRAISAGFKVIALAAFVGQHAQAGAIAAGRPDDEDAKVQREFGRKIATKKNVIDVPIPVGWSSSGLYNIIVFARQFMQGQDYALPGFMKKKKATDACLGCGKCSRNCPAEAIKMEKKPVFNSKKCIACYRCVNECPKHAIQCTSGLMNGIVKNFGKKFENRVEPTIVI